jgi:hypothetical protein
MRTELQEIGEGESVVYYTQLFIRYWSDKMLDRVITLEFDTLEEAVKRVHELRTTKRNTIDYGIDIEALMASDDYWKQKLQYYSDLEIRLTNDFLKVYKKVVTLVPERAMKIANLDN